MQSVKDMEAKYGASNYNPLPIVLVRGSGIYVWDEHGNRYADMMGAYSAVSHGHCHPELVNALHQQASTLAVISRAFYSDKLGEFLQLACELTGQEQALPMNSGAEAVETAIKAARKWAYKVKKVPENQAEIIVCQNNFHGRTTTIVGFSSEAQYRDGFGPFAPGFKTIPYGDIKALEQAITPNTAAFMVEPIQGEAGIIVPPAGYLKQCADLCKKNNVLLICDEVQTGLGRTGKLLAAEHDGVRPDGVILGKALGGGLLPVSLFLSRKEIMQVFTPGDHGSTFGGNPLAAAVGKKALELIVQENLTARAAELGNYLMTALKKLKSPLITEVRGKGLLVGLEINPSYYSAREMCLKLMKEGVLTKDVHDTVIRLAPPLIITTEQLDAVIASLTQVLRKAETEAKEGCHK